MRRNLLPLLFAVPELCSVLGLGGGYWLAMNRAQKDNRVGADRADASSRRPRFALLRPRR